MVNNTLIPLTVDRYTTDSQSQHIGRCVGRHFGRLSVDISAESVDWQRSLLHMIKTAWACRVSAISGLWKIYKCLFIPNRTRKIMWLLINNMHEKILEMVKQKKCTHVMQSAEKLCAHLIWKQKISFVLTNPYYSLANHNPEFRCVL